MNPPSDNCQRQVALLWKTLPQIAKEPDFALGGGSAINFFFLDQPRLSVDVELTYLPVAPRSVSLAAIHDALQRIAQRIQASNRGILINFSEVMPDRKITKLLIRQEDAQITIEVDPLRRGSVFPPQSLPLSPSAAVEYARGSSNVPSSAQPSAGLPDGMKILSPVELYAQSMVDALHQQFPQTFYDLQGLSTRLPVDMPLRGAFLVYLLSCNRPLAELLIPTPNSFRADLLGSLERLAISPLETSSLAETRNQVTKSMIEEMPQEHRHFLMAFERGQADWSRIELPQAQHLPAILARGQYLAALPHSTRTATLSLLEGILFPTPPTPTMV